MSVPSADPPSIEALLRAGLGLLREQSDSPRLDAEVLLAHATGRDRAWLFSHREDCADAAAARRFLDLVEARREGRPVAHLIGSREFWSLPLVVTPDVLTPRPDTETLVERALLRIPPAARLNVLDLGTGTGAVALAIATERPACTITATDLSEAALGIARQNAARLHINSVNFRPGDWWAAVAGERFDVVVANPPYLAEQELGAADPALRFEPRLALTAGADGLAALRIIAAGTGAHLLPGGWLLLEHGATQGEAVRPLLAAAGFTRVTTTADLAGRPRVTEGQR